MLKYVSDLHLEYKYLNSTTIKNIYNNKINPTKYLALVGDIGNFTNNNLTDFLKHCSHSYDKVLYVPGNHEYWSDRYTLDEINTKLEEHCSNNNIAFLNNSTYTINNTKFIGSTLWSQIKVYNTINIKGGNYKNIYKDKSILLTPHDTSSYNITATKFIKDNTVHNGPVILLTHYPPIHCDPKNNQYTSDPVYYNKFGYDAYHSNIESIIKDPVKVCIYGHTHYNSKFTRNNIIYRSNQLGRKVLLDFTLTDSINIDQL